MRLDQVLEGISGRYPVRFAFDPAIFGNILTQIEVKDIPVADFLKILKDKYFVESTRVGTTWVLTQVNPGIAEPVQVQKEVSPPGPVLVSGFVRDFRTGENLMYCNVVS